MENKYATEVSEYIRELPLLISFPVLAKAVVRLLVKLLVCVAIRIHNDLKQIIVRKTIYSYASDTDSHQRMWK